MQQGWVIFIVIVVLYLLSCIKVLREYERGVIFRLGRVLPMPKGPGIIFVFYPIAVLWLDADKRVVDKVLARPFRPYYAPRQPAQYFVEGVPGLLEQVRLDDELIFAESSK